MCDRGPTNVCGLPIPDFAAQQAMLTKPSSMLTGPGSHPPTALADDASHLRQDIRPVTIHPSGCQRDIDGPAHAVGSEQAGVRKRSPCSRWLEITGLPVRSANPDGDCRSAPTLATPMRLP